MLYFEHETCLYPLACETTTPIPTYCCLNVSILFNVRCRVSLAWVERVRDLISQRGLFGWHMPVRTTPFLFRFFLLYNNSGFQKVLNINLSLLINQRLPTNKPAMASGRTSPAFLQKRPSVFMKSTRSPFFSGSGKMLCFCTKDPVVWSIQPVILFKSGRGQCGGSSGWGRRGGSM